MDLHTTDRDTRRFGAWITFFFLHELKAADGASHSEYGDQYRSVSLLLLLFGTTYYVASPPFLLNTANNNTIPLSRVPVDTGVFCPTVQPLDGRLPTGILEQEKKGD